MSRRPTKASVQTYIRPPLNGGFICFSSLYYDGLVPEQWMFETFSGGAVTARCTQVQAIDRLILRNSYAGCILASALLLVHVA